MAPEIHHAKTVLLALHKCVQLFLSSVPTHISIIHRLGRNPAEPVKQYPLLHLIETGQALALRMNKRQFRSKLLEHCDSSRLIVDKHSTLACAQNLPAQNDLVPLRIDAVLFQNGFRTGCELEDASDYGLLG